MSLEQQLGKYYTYHSHCSVGDEDVLVEVRLTTHIVFLEPVISVHLDFSLGESW